MNPFAAMTPQRPQLVSNTYIVQLESSEDALLSEITSLAASLDSVLKDVGIPTDLITSRFSTIFPGAIITVDGPDNAAKLEKLANMTSVKSVMPVYRRQMATPHYLAVGRTATSANGSEISLAEGMAQVHTLTDAIVARDKYKLTGKGVKVAVIDSGIDVEHPLLGACYKTPGCRTQFGHNFVDKNDKMSDCNGHGTHLFGIIGANAGGDIVGLAPEATFGAYRVGDCDGGMLDSDVLLALEMAIKDGADIINMSLGWYQGLPHDPISVAVKNAIRQGVIVIIANANYGPGLFTAETPAVTDTVIGVGSIDNLVRPTLVFKTSAKPDQMLPIDSIVLSTVPTVNETLAKLADVPITTIQLQNNAGSCSVPNAADLKNKVILFESSDFDCSTSFTQTILDNGASAILMAMDPVNGYPALDLGLMYNSSVPAALVPQAILADLKSAVTSSGGKPVTYTGVSGLRALKDSTAGMVSSFSSRGPSFELQLKPQIMAPGGNIYSTWPVKLGSYATMGGTSMASPYIVGVTALYLEQQRRSGGKGGKLNEAKLMALLQNSARNTIPLPGNQSFALGPNRAQLDTPASIGAGLINVTRILDPATAVMTPSQLPLNDTARIGFMGSFIKTLTITNPGSSEATFELTHEPALTVTGVNDDTSNGIYLGKDAARYLGNSDDLVAKVTILPRSIKVPAGSSRTVMATIVPPAASSAANLLPIYGGWIVATPSGNADAAVRTVYMGIKGDFSNLRALEKTPVFSFNSKQKTPDGLSIVDPYSSADTAQFFTYMASASKRFDAYYETNTTIPVIGGNNYYSYIFHSRTLARNDLAAFYLPDFRCSSISDFIVSKRNPRGCEYTDAKRQKVPNGKYRLVVRAQKPLKTWAIGDDNFNVWKSDWFYLNSTRPDGVVGPPPGAINQPINNNGTQPRGKH
ncbi:subtilisin-like protein [Ramicandelaber brevisporus]|nr:subtilisin-like protein [Ramicandelaber brevisporus]